MVLYSKCAYGSQFLGEENDLRIRSLVAEILSKNPVSFFLGHPVKKRKILNLVVEPTLLNMISYKHKDKKKSKR